MRIGEKQFRNEAAAAEARPAPFCAATTRRGRPCPQPATGLTDYCREHQGAS